MSHLLISAFSPGPWSRHLFPPHLRTRPGGANEFNFRLHQLSSRFGSPGREHICATVPSPGGGEEGEEEEVIVGWAQWIDTEGRVGLDEEKEEKMRRADSGGEGGDQGAYALVAGLDREAMGVLAQEGEMVEKRLEEYLGEEGTRNSRLLNFLIVDPSHHRKGIGRLLAREGLDRAAKEGKDVRLRSTPEGRPLYLALGFEGVFKQDVIGEPQYGMVWRAPVAAKPT